MDYFAEALQRLKHELRVSKDTEVALALGFSKTAFAERKKRGSFPSRQVAELAAAHPELGVDVNYVLTGLTQRQGAVQAAAAVLEPIRDQIDLVLRDAGGRAPVLEVKDDHEVKLIRQYRSAAPAGRRAIEATAAAVAPDVLGESTMEPADPTVVTQHFNAAVGQAAGRDMVNTGGKVNVRTPAKKR